MFDKQNGLITLFLKDLDHIQDIKVLIRCLHFIWTYKLTGQQEKNLTKKWKVWKEEGNKEQQKKIHMRIYSIKKSVT